MQLSYALFDDKALFSHTQLVEHFVGNAQPTVEMSCVFACGVHLRHVLGSAEIKFVFVGHACFECDTSDVLVQLTVCNAPANFSKFFPWIASRGRDPSRTPKAVVVSNKGSTGTLTKAIHPNSFSQQTSFEVSQLFGCPRETDLLLHRLVAAQMGGQIISDARWTVCLWVSHFRFYRTESRVEHALAVSAAQSQPV